MRGDRQGDPVRGLRAITALVALLTVGLPGVASAGGTTHAYPGPCGATLQACIDGVGAGDTILVSTNGRIDEDLQISKSLTLRPGPGFDPVIGSADPATPRLISVDDTGGGPLEVTIADLRLDAARVDVFLSNHAGSRFTALRTTVRHKAPFNSASGIDVDVREADTVITIQDNALTTTGAPLEIASNLSAGEDARFEIVGNRMVGAVSQYAYHGIDIDLRGAGELALDIHGNTIRKAMGCNCGGSASLELLVLDTPTVTANIVGNTIDRAQGPSAGGGIDLDVRSTGGLVAVQLFNNVISNGTGIPFWFPDATPYLRVGFGSNAVHRNGQPSRWGGYTPSQLPMRVSPGYVDGKAGDYRLTASSPLRDVGQVCSPGGTARTDNARRFRVAGANVDIGAFEHGAPKAGKGVVRLGTDGPDLLVGTNGRDILCGFGGADELTGGPKPDVLAGGKGPDEIDADDGTPGDLVIGGTGRDQCRFDAGDRVAGCP